MLRLQIVTKKTKTAGNRVSAEVLVMTTKTEDRQLIRTFKYLHDVLYAKNVIFDPLELFSDRDDVMDE